MEKLACLVASGAIKSFEITKHASNDGAYGVSYVSQLTLVFPSGETLELTAKTDEYPGDTSFE